MNWNIKLFKKINRFVGTSPWLDAFGKAGAEWVIVAIVGWYVAADFIINSASKLAIFWPIAFLGLAWALGWLINTLIGLIVREPRPHATYPESKLLFTPLSSWKSFPSDHAMSAWLIFFMALLFNLPGVEALLFMAIWVSWGRVYAGVHYPFDAVGGAAVAALVAVTSYYLLVLVS